MLVFVLILRVCLVYFEIVVALPELRIWVFRHIWVSWALLWYGNVSWMDLVPASSLEIRIWLFPLSLFRLRSLVALLHFEISARTELSLLFTKVCLQNRLASRIVLHYWCTHNCFILKRHLLFWWHHLLTYSITLRREVLWLFGSIGTKVHTCHCNTLQLSWLRFVLRWTVINNVFHRLIVLCANAQSYLMQWGLSLLRDSIIFSRF